MQKKIVLIGGPGTGKSSVLNKLKNLGHFCMPEVSREITLKAQKDGVDQLFLTDPLLFSNLILKGREQQYRDASKENTDLVFFDRGLPDIYAYLEYSKIKYPNFFKEKSIAYPYDYVFLFNPWKKIYTSDNERYENYEELLMINKYLKNAYQEYSSPIIEVPFDTIKNRTDFIINWLRDNV